MPWPSAPHSVDEPLRCSMLDIWARNEEGFVGTVHKARQIWLPRPREKLDCASLRCRWGLSPVLEAAADLVLVQPLVQGQPLQDELRRRGDRRLALARPPLLHGGVPRPRLPQHLPP